LHHGRGSFLAIFQRPTADTKEEKNLTVFSAATGEIVLQLFQKTFTKDTWCVI
jgi:hypothetical protein